jgi:hypothetical protein
LLRAARAVCGLRSPRPECGQGDGSQSVWLWSVGIATRSEAIVAS